MFSIDVVAWFQFFLVRLGALDFLMKNAKLRKKIR